MKEHMQAFQKKILDYYKQKGRNLPWRNTTNRYHILVSEIMLQQTQVDRVIPKYKEWLQTFKTPSALAAAPLSKVLQLWSGLGYNNRAKRLHDAAKIIAQKHNGQVPDTIEELIKLPGVGPYTARSVLIFADNENLATVDTNIRRILIHECKLKETITDKELFRKAQETLPKGKSREWHNALMDYGAQQLTSKASGIKPKTTQPPFKGSRRYYRGRIINHLTSNEDLSLKKAKKLFPDCEQDLTTIFQELEQEGLIQKKSNTYRITS
ncbi:A/G-specific adenine glycosylase [Candidatus Woesearchaeota archaeon]|nr:A/G-specific adenine glycosylase [Candidatus Woesearchaeota archaeon]